MFHKFNFKKIKISCSVEFQNAAMKDQQKDMAYDSSALVQPVQGPAWRYHEFLPCHSNFWCC